MHRLQSIFEEYSSAAIVCIVKNDTSAQIVLCLILWYNEDRTQTLPQAKQKFQVPFNTEKKIYANLQSILDANDDSKKRRSPACPDL